jgi:co-chaperonin GroES (HSP10)
MFKPLKDNVAVVKLKNKIESEAGLIIESLGSDGMDRAKVYAVGPDVTLVGVADTLYIDWTKAKQGVIDGIPLFIIKEEDIHAVLEE